MGIESDQFLIESIELTKDGIQVEFMDGLKGLVPYDEMSVGDDIESIDQEGLKESNGRRVEFTTDDGSVEYPWDFLRRIIDNEFGELEEEESIKAREKLGEHIRKLRNDKSLSQEELAERAGLDRTTISRIERGTHDVSFNTLHSIASALQVAIQEVVQIEEEEAEYAA